jgi:hypothetical protein
MTDRAPTDVAADLLVTTRTGDAVDPHLDALASLDEAELASVRESRSVALAFWLNCYNAGTQLLLDRRPTLYESHLRSLRFFHVPAVTVAGTDLSLDAIEHGILRAGMSKLSLGYLPRVFVSSFGLRHRLREVDPRVHFALNCGAASCPAIRAYEPREVDAQLDLATQGYLDATVEYDPEAGVVRVPRLFLWFRGDFGGARGVRAFLREFGAIPEGATPRLRYLDWDWSKARGEFVG